MSACVWDFIECCFGRAARESLVRSSRCILCGWRAFSFDSLCRNGVEMFSRCYPEFVFAFSGSWWACKRSLCLRY
jgi:hypothetical protein